LIKEEIASKLNKTWSSYRTITIRKEYLQISAFQERDHDCGDPYSQICIWFVTRYIQIIRSRDDETAESMSQSMNYIIIISEKYKGPLKMWVQNEWKYAWHNYKSDPNREIIIINYDMLDNKNVFSHDYL
jgi:hypothetical protein